MSGGRDSCYLALNTYELIHTQRVTTICIYEKKKHVGKLNIICDYPVSSLS